MSVSLSAAAAFRRDTNGRVSQAHGLLVTWLKAATIVEHAGLVSDPERVALLYSAVDLVREEIGDSAVERHASSEWGDVERSSLDAIVVLSDAMQQDQMLHLAGATLDSLLAANPSFSVLQQGRILAKRARVAWKLGLIDEADARYRKVDRLGARENSDELKARAAIGFAALAQMRGNYPELRRWSLRAARLAHRTGLRALIRNAHSGLLIAAAMLHSLDDALFHGWAAYQASIGDPIQEAEVLQNLGQALLEAGHVAAARAVFTAVVSRPVPLRIMLPALGGLARASTKDANADAVLWAAQEVRSLDDRTASPYPLASALIECAIALAQIGETALSQLCRDEALRLAKAHGFHEVEFRADDVGAAASPGKVPPLLRTRAAAVLRELEWMAPSRLPEHIALAASSTTG